MPLWLATQRQIRCSRRRRPPPAPGHVPRLLLPSGIARWRCRGADGAIQGALGLGALPVADESAVLWDAAPLPERLPPGTFRVVTPLAAPAATQFALGGCSARIV